MSRPLSADLCAAAVVAAARALGDDPGRAWTVRRGVRRRATAPAAAATAQATELPLKRVAPLFGVQAQHVERARQRGGDSFVFALTQALLAVGGSALANAPVRAPPPQPSEPEEIEAEYRVIEPVRSLQAPQPATVSSPPPARAPSAVRPTRLSDRPAVFVSMAGERPSHTDASPRPRVDAGDRVLIEAALQAGRVTVCDAQVAAGVELRGLALKAQPGPEPGLSWRQLGKRGGLANARRSLITGEPRR